MKFDNNEIMKTIDLFLQMPQRAYVTWKGGRSKEMKLCEAMGVCEMLLLNGIKAKLVEIK